MTAARTRGSKRIVSNSKRDDKRLEGFTAVVGDWHAKVVFLEVRYNMYYWLLHTLITFPDMHVLILVVATLMIMSHYFNRKNHYAHAHAYTGITKKALLLLHNYTYHSIALSNSPHAWFYTCTGCLETAILYVLWNGQWDFVSATQPYQ